MTGMAVIEIDIHSQLLRLRQGGAVIMECPVSTARNGAGEREGSECTPRGSHEICAKIGAGAEPNTVFVARQATGEIYSREYARKHPGRDWILTRILWLTGVESGYNCGGNVDTRKRYIYIHGAPDEVGMGVPGSRGCIRMRNADIIRLFDLVEIGTEVTIRE
jgi:lipoprotein-anchoring transpeptidase ErfK/SrfK